MGYTCQYKKEWILEYMNSHRGEDIDIFAKDFVKAFITKIEPKNISYYSYGTPKVP